MAHEDLDALLDDLLGFAQAQLAKCGEFFPFGGKVDAAGGISHVQGWTEDERPPSQQLIDLLVIGLRMQAQRREIRASGICSDIRFAAAGDGSESDAISVRLEHANGEVSHVFLPYQRGRDGNLAYGDLFATGGQPDIFK